MDARERRVDIWRSLCCHRYVTVASLAEKYGVTTRTIYYDVQRLSISHPIEAVRGRYYGGIKIPDWYRPNTHVCTPKQMGLLRKLGKNLTGDDYIILTSIIEDFGE